MIASILLSACAVEPPEVELEPYFTPEPDVVTEDAVLPEINMVLVSDDFVMENWDVIEELYRLSGVRANFKLFVLRTGRMQSARY